MNDRVQIIDLRRSWVPPDRLDRSRPRDTRLTGAGWALIGLVAVLFAGAAAAGIGLGSVASREAEELKRLREDGVETEGRVTRVWREKGDAKQPWVAYRFSAQGGVHEDRAKISAAALKSLRPENPIVVRYVPSDPRLNHPRAFRRRAMSMAVPFGVALALSVAGGLALLPILGQRRFLAGGRPAPARVTRHSEEHRSQHGNHGKKFYYQFPLLSGAIGRGESGPTKSPPSIGSTICVLYDPDNPRKNAPYPLALVRPRPR